RVIRLVLRSQSACRCVFFFQAEDGIRDDLVTGVQTCALPISSAPRRSRRRGPLREPASNPSASSVNSPSSITAGRLWPCAGAARDRKSTRLNSSHQIISYAVFCLKKKNRRRRVQ